MAVFIPAFLLLVLGAIVATWMGRRWGRSSEGRRPGYRHWITRAICGALGAAIVVTLAVFTIRDARRAYAEPVATDFRVPTLPPPEVKNDHKPLKKGRFLLHVAIVSWREGAMTPLQGQTYELQLPRDADRSFHSSLRSGGVKVDWQVSISEIRTYIYKSEPQLDVNGTRDIRAKGPSFESGSSGSFRFPELNRVSNGRDQVAFLSMARSASGIGAVLMDLTPVRDDDPLKPGAFEDLLAIRGNDPWMKEIRSSLSNSSSWSDSGSPAEALIQALEVNLVVLLAAALLLAQLFKRRSLGFVKVAACLLLYAGALDRVALRIHQSRLKDPAAPVEQRLVACAHLPSTAFFRKTALRDLEATASDKDAPATLRDLARRLAETRRKNHFP